MTVAELQAYIENEIPITKAIGLRVEKLAGEHVFSAPLAPNVNNKDTGFAGSLNAVVTLACWSIVHLHCLERGLDVDIVLKESQVRFRHPVQSNFIARALRPGSASIDQFDQVLRKKGISKLNLDGVIESDSKICVEFSGTYVAIQRNRTQASS